MGQKPLTDPAFAPPGGEPPGFLLAEHPNEPTPVVAELAVHSSVNGFDFSRSAAFGYNGQAFIAQFGDLAPEVGKVMAPVGFEVVRVDPETGEVSDFAANRIWPRTRIEQQASAHISDPFAGPSRFGRYACLWRGSDLGSRTR